jgi:hypothetical protein
MGVGPRHDFGRVENRLADDEAVNHLTLRHARAKHGNVGSDERGIDGECETAVRSRVRSTAANSFPARGHPVMPVVRQTEQLIRGMNRALTTG